MQGKRWGSCQPCRYKTFSDNSETIWKKQYIKSDGVHCMSRILRKARCYWESISGRSELYKVSPKSSSPDMAILQSPEWSWGRNRMRQEVITTKSPEQRWSNFSLVLTFGCSLKSDAMLTAEILISKIKIYAWEDYCAVGGKLRTF